MNWYKKSQTYMDFGHYEEGGLDVDPGDKQITLWIADFMGSHFEKYSKHPWDYKIHDEIWGEEMAEGHITFAGRHDPFENRITIKMHPNFTKRRTAHDIPNRLIDRLMKEFPGASIFAFPGGIQII